MKKILSLLTLLVAVVTGAWAASGDILFTQNFNSAAEVAYTANTARTYTTSATLSNLVGSGDNLFTSITCNKKGSTGIAINSSTGGGSEVDATGIFQAYYGNTSGYWSICRTSDLADVAPTAIKVSMKVWARVGSSSSAAMANFAIGNEFSDGLTNSVPATTNVHSGFCITNESSMKFSAYNTYGTKIYNTALTQSSWMTLTWVINNSGAALEYSDPASETSTVNNDCFDLWLGTTKIVANRAATTASVDLQNIYIGSASGKNHEIRLDDIVITDLSPVADTPIIKNQPQGGVYQKDATGKTLTVSATPSTGECAYQWYSCDDAEGTNESSLGESAQTATYTVPTGTEGTSYYFCRVSDGGSNTTDTEVATVVVVDRAAKQTWDFTTISEDDIKYNSDTYFTSGFWTRKSSGVYNHNFDKATYGTLQDNFGNDLLNGIQVYRSAGNAPVYVYCDATNNRYGINLQGASDKPGLWKIPVENGKAYKVTYTSNTNITTLGYTLDGDATKVSGDLTATIETAFSNTANFVVTATADGYMTLSNTGTNANNATLVKVEEVELDPEITSVTPDGGSVNGNSAVTIAGVGTIYYQWSESSSATIGSGDWTASTTTTVPNVSGTRYLHVYAANSTTNTEITTKAFTITKVSSVVVKKWDFTQELSSTDLTNIEADGTNWNEGVDQTPNGTRYTNKVAMGGTIKANSTTLEALNGIEMYSNTNNNIGTGNLRINSGAYVQINGTGTYKILDLTEGDVVAVTYVSANTKDSQDRSWSILSSNAILTSAEGTNTINGYVDNTAKTCEYTMTADGDMQLHQSNGLNVYSIIVTRTMPAVDIAVTSYGWATFNSDSPLDLTNVDFAYKVTGVSGSAVTIEAVNVAVEANTPLLIKGTAGSAVTRSIPIAASGSDISSTNKLVAVTANSTSVSKAATGTNYVLAVQNDKAVFAPIEGTAATLNKGQAYLALPEVTAARALFIDFDGETTGISNIDGSKLNVEGYYNLAGQLVSQPMKGLYIVNGKKVVIK